MNRDEKTLILFKPDCVRKNLSGIILQRLLGEGFRLRGMKMMQLDDAILREHYAHIIDLVIDDKPLFPTLSYFMQTSPVVALVLSGPGVITRVRSILGPTNSMKADKGTIRGDYGTNSMLNICHASDSPESAEVEIKRFFKPKYPYEYLREHELRENGSEEAKPHFTEKVLEFFEEEHKQ